MKEFIEVAADNVSLSRRKFVYGVGVNDAWYMTGYRSEEGKQVRCPYYTKWKDTLKRCYSGKFQEKNPTYVGCTVSKEWLLFSNFRKWMEKQDWEGKELDKDLLFKGNKVYSEDTCIFVSKKLNNLLTDCAAAKGNYPQGVSWHKARNKYVAQCNVNGKGNHLGYSTTEAGAEVAYCTFKADLIMAIADEPEATSKPKLQAALIAQAEIFKGRAKELSRQ